MRLSRAAMMARPARLFTRFWTTASVTRIRRKPAVKEAILVTETVPLGPEMMEMPSTMWSSASRKLKWSPSPSTPK